MDPQRDRTSGGRPSVRTLALGWMSIFGALAVVLATLLVVVTTRIRSSTDAVIRDTESLQVSDELEVRLLMYHRSSPARGMSPSPRAASTNGPGEIRGLIATAERLVGSGIEADRVREVSSLIERYLAERRDLEVGGPPADAPVRQMKSSFDAAVAAVESLRDLNRAQVRKAHARAVALDALANRTGLGFAVLLVTGLIVLYVGVARYALRPLAELHQCIRRFRQGDPAVRARELGARETRVIAYAFNDMADAHVEQRRNSFAFLAGVAHDLRNPLSVLKMRVLLLGRELGPAAPSSPTVALLDRQLDRLTRMVNDLLDATRIEAGNLSLSMADCDLREPVAAIVDLYAPTVTTHQIVLAVPAHPVPVRADVQRIEQVVSNLLSNAIKYAPGGGPVRVEVGHDEAAGYVLVADQGVGIPRDDLDDIFVPFHRRAATRDVAPGAGLGLSVVQRIVAAHGGRIEVASEPGQGSTFRVWLPLVPPGP